MKISRLSRFFSDNEAVLWQFPGPILLIGSILLRGEFLFWGTAYMQFIPWRFEAWQMLEQGIFPLWSDKLGMGAPLFANYQTAFLYPPNLLVWLGAYIASIRGIAIAQTVLVMGHLILAGVGMVNFTREIGFGKTAQIISGLGFSLGGYLLARASFLSMNAALAWIPWLLWISTRWLDSMDKGNWKQVIRFSIWHMVILVFQLLAGHAQTTWYTLLLVFGWIISQSISKKFLHIWKKLGIFASICLLATGVSAIQIIPTAEYLFTTARASAVEEGYALNYSFWPWRFLTLFSPDLFGNPGRNTYWVTADNYWEDAIYIGFVPILLAISALWRRHSDRENRPFIFGFAIVSSLFGILFALGRYTPIFPLLYRYIPTFDLFQGPARFTIWLVVGLILLAGLSLSGWKKPSGRRLYWSRLGAMAGVGAVLTSLVASLVLKGKVEQSYLAGAVHTSILFLGYAIFNLFAPDELHPAPGWNRFLILFVFCDLMYAHGVLNPGIRLDALESFDPKVENAAESKRIYLSEADEEKLKFERFFRFDTFLPENRWDELTNIYLPNSNLLHQKPAVTNFDPFVPQRYATWMNEIMSQPGLVTNELLAYLNVDLVENAHPSPSGVAFTTIAGGSRYHFFSCAEVARSEDDALNRVKQKIQEGKINTVVVLESPSEADSNDCGSTTSQVQIHTETNQPDQQQIKLTTNQSGWFVQTDVWYPGWVAIMDGAPVRLDRLDYLFRGVYVPEGTHTIELKYQPFSVRIGFWISLISVLGLLGFCVLSWQWRKRIYEK